MILPLNSLYRIEDPTSCPLQGTESLAAQMGAAERELLYKREKGLSGPGQFLLIGYEEIEIDIAGARLGRRG